MQRIVDWGKAVLNKDTAFANLLLFLVKLCRHWFGEVLIGILDLAIALLTAFSQFGILLWILCGLLLIMLIGSAFCKSYDSHKKDESLAKITALEGKLSMLETHHAFCKKAKDSTLVVNGTASNNIYRVAREIKHEGWEKPLEDIRDVYGFQIMAFAVCKEIYNLLRDRYNLRNHWITLYQSFETQPAGKKQKQPKRHCKMIAYANSSKQEPLSYQEAYPIPASNKIPDDIELHTKIFAGDDVSPKILMTQAEVQREFKIHANSRSRELKIHQYIGLPSTVCNRKIMFLLQIDCDVENGLGRTREEVELLIDDVLVQYISLLKLYYEIDRFSEVGTNHVCKLNEQIERLREK